MRTIEVNLVNTIAFTPVAATVFLTFGLRAHRVDALHQRVHDAGFAPGASPKEIAARAGDTSVVTVFDTRGSGRGSSKHDSVGDGDGFQTVQRRLPTSEIDALVGLCRDGSSIDALARRYHLHRTTVIHHLDQAGVVRRRMVRRMNDESVGLARGRYEQGASLALVAREFGVHQRTLARELRRAGTLIRRRRGWTKLL